MSFNHTIIGEGLTNGTYANGDRMAPAASQLYLLIQQEPLLEQLAAVQTMNNASEMKAQLAWLGHLDAVNLALLGCEAFKIGNVNTAANYNRHDASHSTSCNSHNTSLIHPLRPTEMRQRIKPQHQLQQTRCKPHYQLRQSQFNAQSPASSYRKETRHRAVWRTSTGIVTTSTGRSSPPCTRRSSEEPDLTSSAASRPPELPQSAPSDREIKPAMYKKKLQRAGLDKLSSFKSTRAAPISTIAKVHLAVFGCDLLIEDTATEANDLASIARERELLRDFANKLDPGSYGTVTVKDRSDQVAEAEKRFLERLNHPMYDIWFVELLRCVELVRMAR
ncbi:hypothetical protein AK830_g4515 [Neonectria ditissima]|uniref:Uncharacterized protein n=1 Tax=Neonectria ditissima TaxID=78410 RepID=A0A0P7BMU3_9HYPO|nr:hypothetical protein AK830_g4515 [Neonectria ditissima]